MIEQQMVTAYEFAGALSRDLITLATGTLAISITFAKDLLNSPAKWLRRAMAASWVFFIVSVVAGIVAHMALTGSLVGSEPVTDISDIAMSATQTQILTFALATFLFAISGFSAWIRLGGKLEEQESVSRTPRSLKQVGETQPADSP